jgi:beta-1,2-mannobiose phosphorylase / 1,2-beta-oligomannan phosphorylase
MAGSRDGPFRMRRLGVVMRPNPGAEDERKGVLNPGAARGADGTLYLFPRLVDDATRSRIGVARVRFTPDGDPAIVTRLGYALEPREPYELQPQKGTGGCEDPRVTYLEPLQQYVMTYVALGPSGPRIALAVSEDLWTWTRLGIVDLGRSTYGADFDYYGNKDGALFPHVVSGPDGREALALLHRPLYNEDDHPRRVSDPRPGIWISFCPLDAARRDVCALTTMRHHHLLAEPEYGWEDAWIGGGAPPLHTPLGWLLIYHAVRHRPPRYPGEPKPLDYSAAMLVLDTRDPRRVVYRSPDPILAPEMPDEVEGPGPSAVFPTGVDDRGHGRLDVYYGMADTRIGAACLQIPTQLPVATPA